MRLFLSFILGMVGVAPAAVVDAVVLGDSVTANVRWDEEFPGLHIVNLATPYAQVADVAKQAAAAERLSPDRVFILIGVNDLRWHEASMSVFFQEVTTLAARFSRSKVVVQSIIYVRSPESWPGINDRIRVVNRKLRTWSETHEVTFIDLNSTLAPTGQVETKYYDDGVHLNTVGIKAWAGLLAREMPRF